MQALQSGGTWPGRLVFINPCGLHWCEVRAPDIVMCNAGGEQSSSIVGQSAGGHPVEPTAIPEDLKDGDYFLTYRASIRHEAAAGDE